MTGESGIAKSALKSNLAKKSKDMSNPAESFKINLNQNLWGLLVSYGFLGSAEHYELCTLYWFALISSVVMTISVVFTTFAYTKNYIKNRP